jgi:hypothetical protein
VLLASGYIAGGAIAGIIIAIVQGGLSKVDSAISTWAEQNIGPHSDLLSLFPFLLLSIFLYLVGREVFLSMLVGSKRKEAFDPYLHWNTSRRSYRAY